jgi:hypothetical protein
LEAVDADAIGTDHTDTCNDNGFPRISHEM